MKSAPSLFRPLGWSLLALAAMFSAGRAMAEVKIDLPLARNAYQTNERISLAVVRSGADLKEGPLGLTMTDNSGSRMTAVFPVAGGGAQRTEHVHLNGWLLRPGKYTVEVAVDGATAKTEINVYSHIRQTDYKLINWGRAVEPQEQLIQGENNLGFNLFYGHYGTDKDSNFLRAGLDYMPNCVMSGGHQMDLRMECDWSDPYVVRGGTRRTTRSAMELRTRSNVTGIHFYDEPGLTWHKDAVTGEFTPHMVPWQVRSYQSAFAREPLHFSKVNPQSPQDVATWKQWARWKLGFMDAAWQDAQFGVSYVNPNLMSVTQSQYGFSAFTDGYYFNVVRSLPVTSGHGGYHDWGPGYFNPSLTLELARARDFDKPCWYLPTWYGNTTTDQFRLEQYLSFQTNIQGMMSPPDIEPAKNATARQGVVESNHLMARLGTIFNTMPVTRPPVAMLYSLSHNIRKQTEDMKYTYAHAGAHGSNVYFTYLAGKLMQQQFLAVVDEDVIDGTLAANHKAIILTSIDYLDPEVVTALEDFIADGGQVLVTSDSKVQIKGAINLGVAPAFPDQAKIAEFQKAGKHEDAAKLMTLGHSLTVAQNLAAALTPHFQKAGIAPFFTSDQPGICATRQAAGDVEYLFAVNASHDAAAHPTLGLKSVTAKLGLAADKRPVYDAVVGGPVAALKPQGNLLAGEFRFGPGQMRVFARTARSIGAVRVGTPLVDRAFAVPTEPIKLRFAASVVDEQGGIVSGSIPLQITISDPAGVARYDLYRATKDGVLNLTLPLAANDPAGKWKVTVRELLNNQQGEAAFDYAALRTCAPLTGETWRAVSFGNDDKNIYRFFRVHQEVTIVKGSSAYNTPAAQRLVEVMKPWGVEAKVVDAAEVNKPRPISEDEAKTGVGLAFGVIKPGAENSPAHAGFNIGGAVVLLGTPEDNPLIEFLAKEKFLPFAANAAFPGVGKGYIAWQRDGINAGQESITLIAYDEGGMQEAVGSTYEAGAGLDPLTPLKLPARNRIEAPAKPTATPSLAIAWQAVVPDRVVGLAAAGEGVKALSHDGTLVNIGPDGKTVATALLDPAGYAETEKGMTPKADLVAEAQKRVGPTRLVKFALPHAGGQAVAYWGGRLELVDASGNVQAATDLPQDITALTTAGTKLIAGLADGQVIAIGK